MRTELGILGLLVGAMATAGCTSTGTGIANDDAQGQAPYDAAAAYQSWADQIQSAALPEQKPLVAGDYKRLIQQQLKSIKAAKKWGDGGKDSKPSEGSPFTPVIRNPGTLLVDQTANRLWVGDGTGVKLLPRKKTWWSRSTVNNLHVAQVFDIQPDGSLKLVTVLMTKKPFHVGVPTDSEATPPKRTATDIADAMNTALGGGRSPTWIKGSKAIVNKNWNSEKTNDNGLVETTDVWQLEAELGTWPTTEGGHIVVTTHQEFQTTSYPSGWVNSYAEWPLRPGAYRHIERTHRAHTFWLVPPADSEKRVKQLGGLTVGSIEISGDRIGPVEQ